MKNAVLITGANGGIGSALVKAYKKNGWFVIGTSRSGDDLDGADAVIKCDLDQLVLDSNCRDILSLKLREILEGKATLKCLVNNAALQILSPLGGISLNDWDKSFRVNLTAPMLLTQSFLDLLKENNGVVINVGSVHEQATKAEFITYATTKAAMGGMTRAMAVDLAGEVRVVCLAPAATATPMLKSGFEGKPEAYQALADAHPSRRIAEPEEIAEIACFLATDNAGFINGTTFYADGGVLSRLHDPG